MAFSPSSPVTGAAQTGFTSPTYTLSVDVAPDANGKQYAVTALGGTQAGVTTHSVSSPFSLTFWRPKAFKTLGVVDPVTGQLRSVPMNVWKQITRKGVTPLAGQGFATSRSTHLYEIPAGADSADPANVKALVSLSIGAAWQQAAGIGDTLTSGVM